MSDDIGFTEDQRRAIDRVLDEIIPPSPDGRLPGAGQLGIAGYVDRALRSMPELRAMFVESVAALDAIAERRHAQRFADLATHDQAEVIGEHASSEHAFPPILLLHAYSGYYQHARVLAALGLGSSPPHPKGYEMPPNDLSLLDPVRQRAPMYRT
jgi:hypothetical protein